MSPKQVEIALAPKQVDYEILGRHFEHVRASVQPGRFCWLCKHHVLLDGADGCLVEGLVNLVSGKKVARDCRVMRGNGACGPQGIRWEAK